MCFLILISIVLTIFLSMGSASIGNLFGSDETETKVTLEVSMQDYLRDLANHPKDKAFHIALDKTANRFDTTNANYFELFKATYQKEAGEGNLASIFSKPANQDALAKDASDEKVIRFLKARTSKTLDTTINILRQRVDDAWVYSADFKKIPEKGQIAANLSGFEAEDSAWIKNTLKLKGKLGYWETYNAKQVIPVLEDVNKVLSKALDTSNDGNKERDKTERAKTNKSEATQYGENKPNELTEAEFKRQNPLYAKLSPAVSQDGKIFDGPVVGHAEGIDTARVNQYLSKSSVKEVLPVDIEFFWSAKPVSDDNDIFNLYAIKVTTEVGAAPLTGKVISDASAETSRSGGSQITLNMDSKGAGLWKQLTAENVGSSIAIAIDNKVYSAPNVNQEVSGGTSVISGRFDEQEAVYLASIIESKPLPVNLRIVK